MSFYQTPKVGLMFFIYLHMASHQRVLTFSSSNAFDSFADLGILKPKLCVRTQYFDFSFPMTQLRFPSTFRIHHTNTGLYAIRRCTACSSICTGYEFLILLRVTHVVLPSFHWTSISTPFVVFLWHFVPVPVVMNASCSFTYVLL